MLGIAPIAFRYLSEYTDRGNLPAGRSAGGDSREFGAAEKKNGAWSITNETAGHMADPRRRLGRETPRKIAAKGARCKEGVFARLPKYWDGGMEAPHGGEAKFPGSRIRNYQFVMLDR